jgi:phage terminase small subunit
VKKKTDIPAAPSHLTAATRKWWDIILGDYALEPSDLRVLETACVQFDRAEAARKTIAGNKTGALTEDRFGQLKPHPAVEVEQNATRLFLAALRQLGLGLEPSGGGRLPCPTGLTKRED